MKNWNRIPFGMKADVSPNKQAKKNWRPPLMMRTRTEYSASVEAEFELRLKQIKAAEKGEVEDNYIVVHEVVNYLHLGGEYSFGTLRRELCLSPEAIKEVCAHLVRRGVAKLDWYRKQRTITLMK